MFTGKGGCFVVFFKAFFTLTDSLASCEVQVIQDVCAAVLISKMLVWYLSVSQQMGVCRLLNKPASVS